MALLVMKFRQIRHLASNLDSKIAEKGKVKLEIETKKSVRFET